MRQRNKPAAQPWVQARLRVSRPGDALEREADQVADAVMRQAAPTPCSPGSDCCESCARGSDEEVVSARTADPAGPAPRAWHGDLGLAGSHPRPLDPATREWFEPRLGRDLGHIRIHADPVAATSAARLDALAYTVGSQIVFGRGQYAPHTTSGRHLLAHELAHTIQQSSGAAPAETHIARLSPAMCASGLACTTPAGRDAATGRYTLTVYADEERKSLVVAALSGDVGHSWVRLTAADGRYWTYGFWPQTGFRSDQPKADAEGCVHAPDTLHTPTSSRTFELTAAQFKSAQDYAQDVCKSKPKYNLFGLQCTEFVRRVTKAAGQDPAMGFGLIWESPNALHSWLDMGGLSLGGTYDVLGDGPGNSRLSAALTYRHQFFSLLGAKLRIGGLARLEAGPKMVGLTAAPVVELTTNRVFLPSLYVYGGGYAGGLDASGGGLQGSAGVTAGAGLRFRIDELATVGVEYNEVRSLVQTDDRLGRLMIAAGITLW